MHPGNFCPQIKVLHYCTFQFIFFTYFFINHCGFTFLHNERLAVTISHVFICIHTKILNLDLL